MIKEVKAKETPVVSSFRDIFTRVRDKTYVS